MSAHRLRFLVLVTGLMLVSAFSVSAQGALPGSSRGVASGEGNNMIQGRIHFPAGQSVSGRGIKVSLESVSNFGNNTTVADQDGVFRFTSLPAGAYTIVVDADPEFEKARLHRIGANRERGEKESEEGEKDEPQRIAQAKWPDISASPVVAERYNWREGQ